MNFWKSSVTNIWSHVWTLSRLESDKDVDEYITRLKSKYKKKEVDEIVYQYKKRIIDATIAGELNYQGACSG